MVSRPARACLFALVLGAVASLGPATSHSDDSPVVAAASDLQFAVEEIASAFRRETGKSVRLSTGSTGNFARQIREGAPFEIFMAADESFVLDLYADGLTQSEGDIYAVGRIVLMRAHDSPLAADGTLTDLGDAIAEGRLSRFAIAHPEHAPYGMRAEEALRSAGLWEAIQPMLVHGENVSQAAQFALSGSAEGGIIAYSLALAPQLADQGTFDLIPAQLHQPLVQRMVLLPAAGEVAEAFYAFVNGSEGREIMQRHGFLLPGEEPDESG
jgi:molybdate transport system substrate-binding protein